VIGWAWDDDQVIRSLTLHNMTEADLLKTFAGTVGRYETFGPKTVVGHNVSFDIRFLWQRAIVLGVEMPPWFPRQPKPWDRSIFDTMTEWAGVRDTISLDNLAKALGLGGKTGMDGSMVAEAWAAGRVDDVASYCRRDVELVRNIHRKMQLAMGEAA
jgi:hypothetical protein